MDIVKKNIHMGRMRGQAVYQASYEDDLNIPENKPDVSCMLLQQGEVEIQEMKAMEGAVQIKGRLLYQLLYATKEEGCALVALEGSLLFEEKVILTGAMPADQVDITARVEDLTIGIINSRKLSVQALVQFQVQIEDLLDEGLPVELHCDRPLEYRTASPCGAEGGNPGIAQLCVCKKDLFRVKEECVLPSNYPNVYQVLCYRIKPMDLEFRVLDHVLEISGDMQICMIYEGEGEGHPVRAYETTISFNGKQDCTGAQEGMVPDVLCTIVQKEIQVKPDKDGEERCLAIEVSLEQDIRIYEELQMEMITDVYGVQDEVMVETHQGVLQSLVGCVSGKMKLVDHIQLSGDGQILQILCCDSEATRVSQTIQKDGIVLKGFVHLNVVSVTGSDENPYSSTQLQLPYQYVLEIPGICETDEVRTQVQVEQLQISLLDGEEADLKAVLSFQAIAFRKTMPDIMDGITVAPQDKKTRKELPGFAIYRVKPGDNLWSIGKKYYVSVDSIRRLNGLTGDLIMPGQKLLIMKEQKK